MVAKSAENRIGPDGGLVGVILRSTLRLLQLIVSISIIAIFGADLNGPLKHDRDHPERKSRQWVHDVIKSDWSYGVVVAGISLIVSLVYLLPMVKSFRTFFVDGLLAIWYLILFGIWGRNYIPRDCKADHDCDQLKISAYFALAGWLLWTISAGFSFRTFEYDRNRAHSGSWRATIRGGRRATGYPHSNV